MPSIKCDKEELDRLYQLVSRSIVNIRRYENRGQFVDFASGFLIYSDRTQAFICVHQSIIKEGERIFVEFSDGRNKTAKVFLKNTPYGHAILLVDDDRRRHVISFSEVAIKRQSIFTVAEVLHNHGNGFMSGTVIVPNCVAVDHKEIIVPGSKNIFAMSCPVAGHHLKRNNPEQLIGAAVFDKKGLVVGTIDSVDETSFDLKYALQAHAFVDQLEHLLQEKDKKISLSRNRYILPKAGQKRKGGNTPKAGASSGGGSTSGAGTTKSAPRYSVGIPGREKNVVLKAGATREVGSTSLEGTTKRLRQDSVGIARLIKMEQSLERFVSSPERIRSSKKGSDLQKKKRGGRIRSLGEHPSSQGLRA